MNSPVFILGYMGSGKTTFGRALASTTGRQFIDLDEYIVNRFRKSVTDIFREKGESGFRDLEASMLREVGEFEDVVIACGGGTPCCHDNMEYMLSRGLTVFLDTSEKCICRRLISNSSRRPLISGKSADEIKRFVHSNLAERMPHYRRAVIRFAGDELESRREIRESVAAFMKSNMSQIRKISGG